MHWLTWQEFLRLFATWQGVAVAAFTVFATICYGPRKVLETLDWYKDRFWDSKVREYLDGQTHPVLVGQHGPVVHGQQRKVEQIAEATGFSQKRIEKSLARLRKKGLVVFENGKWRTPSRAGY